MPPSHVGVRPSVSCDRGGPIHVRDQVVSPERVQRLMGLASVATVPVAAMRHDPPGVPAFTSCMNCSDAVGGGASADAAMADDAEESANLTVNIRVARVAQLTVPLVLCAPCAEYIFTAVASRSSGGLPAGEMRDVTVTNVCLCPGKDKADAWSLDVSVPIAAGGHKTVPGHVLEAAKPLNAPGPRTMGVNVMHLKGLRIRAGRGPSTPASAADAPAALRKILSGSIVTALRAADTCLVAGHVKLTDSTSFGLAKVQGKLYFGQMSLLSVEDVRAHFSISGGFTVGVIEALETATTLRLWTGEPRTQNVLQAEELGIGLATLGRQPWRRRPAVSQSSLGAGASEGDGAGPSVSVSLSRPTRALKPIHHFDPTPVIGGDRKWASRPTRELLPDDELDTGPDDPAPILASSYSSDFQR